MSLLYTQIGTAMVDSSRFQIIFPTYLKDAAKKAAQEKGISLAEFIKDAVKVALKEIPSGH